MKVLYIGCYRDGTGWGQAATDYILAMDTAGIDVVPRPIKLNSNQIKVPDRIIELEKNYLNLMLISKRIFRGWRLYKCSEGKR